MIAGLNPTLRGWFEYFKHSHLADVRQGSTAGYAAGSAASFASSRRQGMRGYGADQIRWPNAFFDGHGLFSLRSARRCGQPALLEVRPPTGEPDAGRLRQSGSEGGGP